MSATVVFDTLAYTKKLKAAGFSEQQAEAQAEAMFNIIEERLATKQDLHMLEERLTYHLTIRLSVLLAASISIVVSLVKLI